MSNQSSTMKGGVGALALALGATVGAAATAEELVVVDPGTGAILDPGNGAQPEVAAPGRMIKIETPARFIKIGDIKGEGVAEFIKIDFLPAVQQSPGLKD